MFLGKSCNWPGIVVIFCQFLDSLNPHSWLVYTMRTESKTTFVMFVKIFLLNEKVINLLIMIYLSFYDPFKIFLFLLLQNDPPLFSLLFWQKDLLSTYRVSQKKLSFSELSFSRFVTNIISISSQLEAGSPKAQFGKTQFFLDTLKKNQIRQLGSMEQKPFPTCYLPLS